ncbi:hypothetical protein CsSME_00012314 [Camellia sinensis var. sinensis]
MKRKKRKRIEDTVAMASYMSHHNNLFSYFGRDFHFCFILLHACMCMSIMTDKWYVSKNKRSAAVVASIDDDRGKRVILAEKSINVEFGVNDELLSHELRDGDNSLEQILWKLGIVQSQDSKMKSRLHKVMLENVGKFYSIDKLSLLVSCNALTSSAQIPASPHNNVDRTPTNISSYISSFFFFFLIIFLNFNSSLSGYIVGNLVMPETAASSHRGEVIHVPDIIESTDQP